MTNVELWWEIVQETEVHYAYDGLDRLIGREEVDVPSSQTYAAVMYLPDGMDRAFELAFVMDAATTTADGAIIQSYLHGPAPGEVLANDVSMDGEFTATYWTFADPSGTLRSYVNWDDDLEVFGHFHNHFDEFGNLQDSGSSFPSGPFLPPIFDGRLEDPIASLYLDSTGGNAYHPETGRLLTATAGDAYAYQHNNPIFPEKINTQAVAQIDWDELEGPGAFGTWGALGAGLYDALSFGLFTQKVGGEGAAEAAAQHGAYWAGLGIGIAGTIFAGGYGAGALPPALEGVRAAQGATLTARAVAGVNAAGALRLGAAAYTITGDVVGVVQGGVGLATGTFQATDLLGFAPTIGWAASTYRGARGFSRGVVAGGSAQPLIRIGLEFEGFVPYAPATRSLDEALDAARARGIRGLEHFQLNVVSDIDFEDLLRGTLPDPHTALAYYGPRGRFSDMSRVRWRDAYSTNTGRIPILLRESVLNSDEAIVGVLRHEIAEISRVRRLWRGPSGQFNPNLRVPASEIIESVNYNHQLANWYTRQRILRMREGT